MESLLEKIAYAAGNRGVPENVNLLGRTAAKRFLEKEADSLTDVVSEIAKERRLSKHEIEQLAQTANQITWQEGFHSTNNGAFQFDPADATQVLEAVSSKGEEIREPNLGYYKDPDGEPTTSGDAWEDFARAELRGKGSSEEYEQLDPHEKVAAAREDMSGATDFLRRRVDELTAETAYEGDQLYQAFRDAHVSGGYGILQLSKMASAAFDDRGFGAQVMKTIVTRMEEEGVVFNEQQELLKMASSHVVNPEHDLYKQCQGFEKLARAMAFRAEQYEEFKGGTLRLDEILRERLRTNA